MGDGWLRAVEPVDRETLRRRLHSAARAWEFDLWRRASHGPITRLVDQDQFLTMTDWALGHRHRTGRVVAAIVADVGGLSDETGTDRQRAAEWRSQAVGRMLAVIGVTAAATRVGTDEFAFLRHDLRDPAQASEIAGQIRDAARRPLGGYDLPGTMAITVGIAVAAQHDTAETLITGARMAARSGRRPGC